MRNTHNLDGFILRVIHLSKCHETFQSLISRKGIRKFSLSFTRNAWEVTKRMLNNGTVLILELGE